MTKIIIIGGGTAGISFAAQLKRKSKGFQITLFEPSEYHYYQPLYTLVGAGADKKEKTKCLTTAIIPKEVNWIKQRVATILPEENKVIDESANSYSYDYLVVAPGIQIQWDAVTGLRETLGKNGVCSVYGYQEAEDTFNNLKNFEGGTALFTSPNTPVKCGGAPQKIMYLTDAYLRKHKLRQKSKIVFASGGSKLFAVPGFTETLEEIIKDRAIEPHYSWNLIKVDGRNKLATFQVKLFQDGIFSGTTEKSLQYDFLHVVPPQTAPDFIKDSPLSIQEGAAKGWLDVDHFSLQHNRYSNVFGLGDVCGLPTGKTGAAVRKQIPVVINNILRLKEGQIIDDSLKYNGYSACPILTDYSHVLMAEFEYGYKPKSSFWFDTTKPRWSMYLLKHYFLPWFYWRRMLKGKE